MIKSYNSSMKDNTFSVFTRCLITLVLGIVIVTLMCYIKFKSSPTWTETAGKISLSFSNFTGLPNLFSSSENKKNIIKNNNISGKLTLKNKIKNDNKTGKNNNNISTDINDLKSTPPSSPIPKANIVIYLKSKIMLVRSYDKKIFLFKNIHASVKSNKKKEKDDGKNPVGQYRVIKRISKPNNNGILIINYPNNRDAAEALAEKRITPTEYASIIAANKKGLIPEHTGNLGKEICIGFIGGNFANGSFLLPPDLMKKLWDTIPVNTPVWIVEK